MALERDKYCLRKVGVGWFGKPLVSDSATRVDGSVACGRDRRRICDAALRASIGSGQTHVEMRLWERACCVSRCVWYYAGLNFVHAQFTTVHI
jgi:hypothetical protein